MKKILFIGAIATMVLLGVGVYFFDIRAQEVQLNINLENKANGRSVTISWINPEIKLAKINIYQSNSKKNLGTLAATLDVINPGENGSVTVNNLITKQLYYFTAIGEKPNGQKITLGQISDVPVKYSANIILSSQDKDGWPLVKIFDANNQKVSEFYPFGQAYAGTIDIARLDLDGDAIDELIIVPTDRLSQVKVFNQQGTLITGWEVYEPGYNFGLTITSVDVDNFDAQEKFFAVGPKRLANSKHKVKIYRYDTSSAIKFVIQDEIVPFENFDGGVNLSSADFNGDGRNELITTPIGGLAEVKIFKFCVDQNDPCAKKYGTQRFTRPESVFDHIFPYGKTELQDIKVKSFDLNRDGKDELIVYPMRGRSTIMKVYGCELNQDSQCLAKELDAKQVYGDRFKGGINVTAFEGKNNEDRYLLISPQTSGGPHLKLYKWDKKLSLVKEFFAYDHKFTGGVETAALKLNNQNNVSIIAVPQKNGGPHLKIFDVFSGKVIEQYFAFDQDFTKNMIIR